MTVAEFLKKLRLVIRDRQAELDQSNRKGLEPDAYHQNVGRLQELERVDGMIDDALKQVRIEEDDDDIPEPRNRADGRRRSRS